MHTAGLSVTLARIVTLILTACLAAATVAEARDLIVYSAMDADEVAMYLNDFREKHPEVGVRIVRDSTGIITARLLAEQDNPQADVVWGLALTSLLICDGRGMFAPYTPEGIDRIRPRFIDGERAEPHWVGIKGWMSVFVGNTVELERRGLAMPQSFADLLDPAYEGQVIMPNPASSGTGYLTVSAILQLFGEEAGWAYLDALHANVAFYTHSGSRPGRLAGTGEFLVGVSFGFRAFQQKARGEPVTVSFPKEGSGWELEANALVRKPRAHPAARLFLDWAISEDVMRIYGENYAILGAKDLDIEPPEGFPRDPESQLIANDFAWAAENRERIIREWSRRYE